MLLNDSFWPGNEVTILKHILSNTGIMVLCTEVI